MTCELSPERQGVLTTADEPKALAVVPPLVSVTTWTVNEPGSVKPPTSNDYVVKRVVQNTGMLLTHAPICQKYVATNICSHWKLC